MTYKEICDIVYNIEKCKNLFDVKVDNYCIWDVIRYNIINEIVNGNFNKYYNKSSKVSFFKKIKIIIAYLRSYFYIEINLKAKKWLFFSASRNIDYSGNLIDVASQNLKLYLKSNMIILESYANLKNNYNYHKRILILFAKLKYFDISKYKNSARYFSTIIANAFNIDRKEIYNKIIKLFWRYEFDKWYFQRILKKVKPKAVFLTQDGIQKGLIYSCKKKNIPIFECQHGFINKYHPAYSYPSDVEYKNNIATPDFLLLFSNYWKNQFFMPNTNVVVIGNDYFADPLHTLNQKGNIEQINYLLVVSSDLHQLDLEPIINEILNSSNINIILKLHPNQRYNYKNIILKYKKYNQIQVILNEISISKLIKNAKCLLLIQSTACYEAINFGKPVIILKRGNYNLDTEIFTIPGVYLVNSSKEIIKIIEMQPFEKVKKTIFFEPFDPTPLKQIGLMGE